MSWRRTSGNCVLLWPLIDAWKICYRKLPEVLSNSLELGCFYFWTSAAHQPSWERGNNLFCCLQSAGYDSCGLFERVVQTVQIFQIFHQMGIVVVSDFGNLEIRLILLLNLAELPLLVNCWRAFKNRCASIDAQGFSLRICGCFVKRAFFCFPGEVPGEQSGCSSGTPRTKSDVSSGLRIGSSTHPLQGEDHSGSVPLSFPGFVCLNFRMSPDRIRSDSGLVGSGGIRLDLKSHSKCDFLSYWASETVSLPHDPQFFLTLE